MIGFKMRAATREELIEKLALYQQEYPRSMSEAVLKARERHGKPFSFEMGSDWRPHDTPVLTAWLQSRGKGEVK